MKNIIRKNQKIKLLPKAYLKLPESPGVYLFLKKGSVIYVGKSINLKKRVASYFRLNLETKTERMVTEADEISYIRVENELESLLLEAKLIKKYMPKYNFVAKDNKNSLHIGITKENLPRVLTLRKPDSKKGVYISLYGPFPSSNEVRSVLKMIRKVFPFSDHKQGKKPCFHSQIGLCQPCPNNIAIIKDQKLKRLYIQEYKKNIRQIKYLLDGKSKMVKNGLKKEMDKYSQKKDFEKAKSVYIKIKTLEYITGQHVPTELYLENPNLVSEIRNKELKELENLLKIHFPFPKLRTIECFDVAHLQGTGAAASMVSFVNGDPDKSKFRHFKIRQPKTKSDNDSLRETIKRRLEHLKDWGKPDLIIVDGGINQVRTFLSVLSSKNIKIPVVGVAKHPDRLIVGNEKIKLSGHPHNLISRIRNEAHRFARVYHHKLYSRSLFERFNR